MPKCPLVSTLPKELPDMSYTSDELTSSGSAVSVKVVLQLDADLSV